MGLQRGTAFELSEPVLEIKQTVSGDQTFEIMRTAIPRDAPEQIRTILNFVGTQILSFDPRRNDASTNWLRDPHTGLLAYPERHVGQQDDVSFCIIAVHLWRGCTEFVLLQRSAKGLSIHTYFSDSVNHPGEAFGTDCPYAYESYATYREKMLTHVVDFFDRAKLLWPMHILAHHTEVPPDSIRVGLP